MKKVLLVLSLTLFALGECGPAPTVTFVPPTAVPPTSAPTPTPTFTPTVVPPSIPTPEPTASATPTVTALPTATPVVLTVEPLHFEHPFAVLNPEVLEEGNASWLVMADPADELSVEELDASQHREQGLLTRVEAEKDVRYLFRLFKHGYAGFGFFAGDGNSPGHSGIANYSPYLELAESGMRTWSSNQDLRVTEPPATIPNPGQLVVVLTDARVGSSAEMLIGFLRQLENVVFVGENSWGVERYGELGVYYLPHSGLRVRLGNTLFLPFDLSDVEERGYMPDLWVPASKALRYALAAIEKGWLQPTD